jgi:hypothetical protein
MEKIDISMAAVVAHLLISLIPWLIGIAIGGGLGLVCGYGIRASFSAVPVLRRPFVLLPWRTLVMGLLMVVWSPFIVSLLGIGPVSGSIMTGSSIGLLAWALAATILVEHGLPSPLSVRLIAAARTLAIASGLIAAGVGVLGGGGLGHLLLEAARVQEYGLVLKGALVIVTLALVLDLGLGLVQLITVQLHKGHVEPIIANA